MLRGGLCNSYLHKGGDGGQLHAGDLVKQIWGVDAAGTWRLRARPQEGTPALGFQVFPMDSVVDQRRAIRQVLNKSEPVQVALQGSDQCPLGMPILVEAKMVPARYHAGCSLSC